MSSSWFTGLAAALRAQMGANKSEPFAPPDLSEFSSHTEKSDHPLAAMLQAYIDGVESDMTQLKEALIMADVKIKYDLLNSVKGKVLSISALNVAVIYKQDVEMVENMLAELTPWQVFELSKAKWGKGRTILSQAASYGNVKTTRCLLHHMSHDLAEKLLKIPDSVNVTPLFEAIASRNVPMIKLLFLHSPLEEQIEALHQNEMDIRAVTDDLSDWLKPANYEANNLRSELNHLKAQLDDQKKEMEVKLSNQRLHFVRKLNDQKNNLEAELEALREELSTLRTQTNCTSNVPDQQFE